MVMEVAEEEEEAAEEKSEMQCLLSHCSHRGLVNVSLLKVWP